MEGALNRRDILQGLGAVTAAAAVSTAYAQQHDHAHHHGTSVNQALIAAASDCIAKSEICLAHCIELLPQDKDLEACSKTSNQVLALCTALRSLAAQNAPALPKLASVAMQACKNCETECRKHEKVHQVCKDCADSCAACAAECKKVAV